MGALEGIIFAITVLTAVVRVVDMVVDKFWPESKTADLVDKAEELLDDFGDVANDVQEVITTGDGSQTQLMKMQLQQLDKAGIFINVNGRINMTNKTNSKKKIISYLLSQSRCGQSLSCAFF